MYVPCGKCLACRSSKGKEWALRCFLELDSFKGEGAFVTLTYNEDNVPQAYDEKNDCYVNTLYKRDLQLFLKRLRKALPYPIRYFACGEYGDGVNYQAELMRPHYHLIVFGLKFEDEQIVANAWQNGFISVDSVNIKTIRYVTGYVKKKVDKYYPKGFFDTREQVFQLFSKGLGKDYCINNSKQIEQQMFITMDGKKNTLPRYFMKVLEISPKYQTIDKRVKSDVISIAGAEQRKLNMESKYAMYLRKK